LENLVIDCVRSNYGASDDVTECQNKSSSYS